MSSVSRYTGEPAPASGDFYVEKDCCTLCGVPEKLAPDLIGIGQAAGGWGHCYWKKQPETEAEMQQAFAIFDDQDLGCHRYAGTDPEIIARLGPENCGDLGKYVSEGFFRRLWNRVSRR